METGFGQTLSAELHAANERLLALRAQLQAKRADDGAGRSTVAVPSVEAEKQANSFLPPPNMPAHLGWGSGPLTAVLRASQQPQLPADAPPLIPLPELLPEPQPEPLPPPDPAGTTAHITLYPQLALAMLKQHQEAAGRVWLLSRYVDSSGRGWLTIDEVRKQLTNPDSPHHICTWRQLRNLLNMGKGLFWELSEGRVWLRSLVRVAHDLEVERLQNKAIRLPLTVLLGGIGDLRAHFYASFHSGRDKDSVNEVGQCEPGRPIARATIQTLSGVGRCSQRNYDKRAKVQITRNYAIGEVATDLNREQRAAEKSNATFELKDVKGKQGPKQQSYMAWQLPNSYSGPHPQESHSRKQRRINRQLADLRIERAAGNDRPGNDVGYYGNGKLAVKGFNRNSHRECYFPTSKTKKKAQLWGVLAQRQTEGRK